MNTEKFLEFNGNKLTLVKADGSFWIAIKPICTALGINYDRQFKNIKASKFFAQLYANQHTTGADGKTYKMVCIPEKFIYGWLLSINSENENLVKYQMECYEVLYNHFHLKETLRLTALTDRHDIENKITELELTVSNIAEVKLLKELQAKRKAVKHLLEQMDNGIYQTEMF